MEGTIASQPEIKEPKFSSFRILKSKMEGLSNYKFDDKINLSVEARIVRIGETYDKKDVEYEIQPINIQIKNPSSGEALKTKKMRQNIGLEKKEE